MAMFNGIEAGLIPAVPNSSGSSFARQHAQSKQDQDKARNAVNKKLRLALVADSVVRADSCDLHEVPQEVLGKLKLRELVLSKNRISVFPSDICSLAHLRVLKLDANLLREVPPDIQHLSQLQLLDLSHNDLAALPLELGMLMQLTSINLYHNPLSGSFPVSGSGASTATPLTFAEAYFGPSHATTSSILSNSGPARDVQLRRATKSLMSALRAALPADVQQRLAQAMHVVEAHAAHAALMRACTIADAGQLQKRFSKAEALAMSGADLAHAQRALGLAMALRDASDLSNMSSVHDALDAWTGFVRPAQPDGPDYISARVHLNKLQAQAASARRAALQQQRQHASMYAPEPEYLPPRKANYGGLSFNDWVATKSAAKEQEAMAMRAYKRRQAEQARERAAAKACEDDNARAREMGWPTHPSYAHKHNTFVNPMRMELARRIYIRPGSSQDPSTQSLREGLLSAPAGIPRFDTDAHPGSSYAGSSRLYSPGSPGSPGSSRHARGVHSPASLGGYSPKSCAPWRDSSHSPDPVSPMYEQPGDAEGQWPPAAARPSAPSSGKGPLRPTGASASVSATSSVGSRIGSVYGRAPGQTRLSDVAPMEVQQYPPPCPTPAMGAGRPGTSRRSSAAGMLPPMGRNSGSAGGSAGVEPSSAGTAVVSDRPTTSQSRARASLLAVYDTGATAAAIQIPTTLPAGIHEGLTPRILQAGESSLLSPRAGAAAGAYRGRASDGTDGAAGQQCAPHTAMQFAYAATPITGQAAEADDGIYEDDDYAADEEQDQTLFIEGAGCTPAASTTAADDHGCHMHVTQAQRPPSSSTAAAGTANNAGAEFRHAVESWEERAAREAAEAEAEGLEKGVSEGGGLPDVYTEELVSEAAAQAASTVASDGNDEAETAVVDGEEPAADAEAGPAETVPMPEAVGEVGAGTDALLADVDPAEAEKAATTVQAAFRGHQARKQVLQMRVQSKRPSASGNGAAAAGALASAHAKMDDGAGHGAPEGLLANVDCVEAEKAATTVQAAFRGHQARKQVSMMREQSKDAAASVVEGKLRIAEPAAAAAAAAADEGAMVAGAADADAPAGDAALEHAFPASTSGADVLADVDPAEAEKAATTVQAAFRGHQARKQVSQMRVQGKRPSASGNGAAAAGALASAHAKMDAGAGHGAPEGLLANVDSVEAEKAATTVQAAFRGHQARKQVSKMRGQGKGSASVESAIVAEQPQGSGPADAGFANAHATGTEASEPQVAAHPEATTAHGAGAEAVSPTAGKVASTKEVEAQSADLEPAGPLPEPGANAETDAVAEALPGDVSPAEAEKAATTVQAAFRGHQARKQVSKMRFEAASASDARAYDSVQVSGTSTAVPALGGESAADEAAAKAAAVATDCAAAEAPASAEAPDPAADAAPNEAGVHAETCAGAEALLADVDPAEAMKAATTVQAAFRGHQARKQVSMMRSEVKGGTVAEGAAGEHAVEAGVSAAALDVHAAAEEEAVAAELAEQDVTATEEAPEQGDGSDGCTLDEAVDAGAAGPAAVVQVPDVTHAVPDVTEASSANADAPAADAAAEPAVAASASGTDMLSNVDPAEAEKAATTVQAAFRGHQARKQVSMMREQSKDAAASSSGMAEAPPAESGTEPVPEGTHTDAPAAAEDAAEPVAESSNAGMLEAAPAAAAEPAGEQSQSATATEPADEPDVGSGAWSAPEANPAAGGEPAGESAAEAAPDGAEPVSANEHAIQIEPQPASAAAAGPDTAAVKPVGEAKAMPSAEAEYASEHAADTAPDADAAGVPAANAQPPMREPEA